MQRRSKIAISVFLTLFFLVVALNLPFIPYYSEAYCHTEYESYLSYEFPCGIFNFCADLNDVGSVTISSASLHAGYSANSSTTATASFSITLRNPACNSSFVSSVILTGNQIPIILWDNSTSPSSAGNLIDFSSAHLSNILLPAPRVTSFVFYPAVQSGQSQLLMNGKEYNYVISIANGQSVSGSLIAQ